MLINSMSATKLGSMERSHRVAKREQGVRFRSELEFQG